MVVDGFAEELPEQGDDVPDGGVGQVGGQVPGEGFDVLAGDGVEALVTEGGQDVRPEHAAVTGHGRVGGEVGGQPGSDPVVEPGCGRRYEVPAGGPGGDVESGGVLRGVVAAGVGAVGDDATGPAIADPVAVSVLFHPGHDSLPTPRSWAVPGGWS